MTWRDSYSTDKPTDPIEHHQAIIESINAQSDNIEQHPELKNSIGYWFPRVRDAVYGLDTVEIPTTILVDAKRIRGPDAIKMIEEGVIPDSDAALEDALNTPGAWDGDAVKRAVDRIGYPAFIRTDMESAKHNIQEASRIDQDDIDHINQTVKNLIQSAANKGQGGEARFNFLAVREWLNIDQSFTAFDGTPIGPEVRIFAENGDVHCHHFYWDFDEEIPPGAIDNTDGDWQSDVDDMKTFVNDAVETTLAEAAAAISQAFDGEWSIDFAYTESGDWYVIDLARGVNSWHPTHCEHNRNTTQ